MGGECRREELHVPPHAKGDGKVRALDGGAPGVRQDDPTHPVLDANANPGAEDKLLPALR